MKFLVYQRTRKELRKEVPVTCEKHIIRLNHGKEIDKLKFHQVTNTRIFLGAQHTSNTNKNIAIKTPDTDVITFFACRCH